MVGLVVLRYLQWQCLVQRSTWNVHASSCAYASTYAYASYATERLKKKNFVKIKSSTSMFEQEALSNTLCIANTPGGTIQQCHSTRLRLGHEIHVQNYKIEKFSMKKSIPTGIVTNSLCLKLFQCNFHRGLIGNHHFENSRTRAPNEWKKT